LPPTTLVLGGARSGKSAYAERLTRGFRSRVYVATAEALDDEMAARIRRHRKRRGRGWRTVEEPLDIAAVIREHAAPGRPLVVDCLTLWLSNLIGRERDAEGEIRRLIETLAASGGPVVLVSNELGLGVVPADGLARAFVDAHGRMNQRLAKTARRVVFLAAGVPVVLKGRSR
jgi:adenosylcobinamide kinase/adenosylcobinamide-phosphate guanylyltransferase